MQNQTSLTTILPKILNEAPLPIGIYEGPELRFVYINQAGADAIRMKISDVLGKTYAEVLPHAPERVEMINQVFQTGIPFQKEMELVVDRDEKGKPISEYIKFVSLAYRDESGNIKGVASFGTVVTSEVETKKKLAEQGHRTSQILDHLSTGFFSVDRNWNFNYANPASEPALGLPPSEVIGKNVWELHPHLVGSEFYHAYHKSMNERVQVEVVNYYPEQDKWYHTSSYPLDEGIAVSFTDITTRKKAEEARALSDERFHTLTEAMPQMVWITDAQGMANYFNAQWLEKTGTSFEENCGLGWLNVTHPDDRERTRIAWETAATSKIYDVEYRVKMADGNYRWHVARGIPTIGIDGKIKQWIGTTTDIHSQKQTQVALQKAVNARDEFLSVASHELKTPLTVIKLQSELTQKKLQQSPDNIDPAYVSRFAETTEKNIQRLTRMVNEMLDISRVSSENLKLEMEQVSLRTLMEEIVERMTPVLRDAGCELIYEPGEDVTLSMDKFRMEQVMTNLLTNSARYGKGKPVILFSGRNDNCALISVKDLGMGIAPEDHQRIFERFERASVTADGTGLGLGLFIVKSIIQLHHGSIQVKSQLGEGAEFIVQLPLH